MNLIKHFEKRLSLCEIRPFVELKGKDKGIWFPLSASVQTVPDEYADDGVTFGYPVAFGDFTEVRYEKALGVLADDTLELFKEYQKAKKSKETTLYLPDYFTPLSFKNWDNQLPPETFNADDGADIAQALQRQEAYNKAHLLPESKLPPSCQFVAQFNYWRLWHDPTNTEHHKDGLFWLQRPQIHDDVSSGLCSPYRLENGYEWDTLKAIIETKLTLRELQNQRARQFKQNMTLLSKCFGYTAENP